MRTKRTIKNILSTFIPYIILGILGFIKVKVFVKFLSDDIYSLNQLFYQVLGYLSLVDAGFGLLIVQKLYQAFLDKDKEKINKIYSTAKIFFKRIGLLILLIGLIISFFLKLFTKANVDLWYMQIIFLIFVIRNIIDYFFSAPRYVIQADQKLYKVNYAINSIRIIQLLTEIILVSLGVDYLIVIIPSIFVSLILNILINRKIYKLYPWLKDNGIYDKKYLKGTKDIISQKIAGIFQSNTDIILLSTFVNPLSVIIYSSYNYIIKFIDDTLYIIANSITPSFANKINNKKESNSFAVYNELNILFYFIASFMAIMLFLLLNPFINIWIGEKYLVNIFTLILFILISYQFISLRVNYIVINSKGLFKETKNIILLEAIINLIISVTLVFKFNLNGVLIGTILSCFLTTFWYIPKYFYQNIFQKKYHNYLINYGLVTLITAIIIIILYFLKIPMANSIFEWIIMGIVFSLVVGIVLTIIFYLVFKDFRNLFVRGKYYLENRKSVHDEN